MILIQGEIRENHETDRAIRDLEAHLPQVLARDPLPVEVVLRAADSLAREVLSGALDEELGRYLAAGIDGIAYDVSQVAAGFLRNNLEKKYALELGHLPTETVSGKKLLRMPLGILLHISAGNVDALPAYSVLEGLLAGNINLLKLPSMDGGLSIFLLQKLIQYEPCLQDYIYVFDTPSSDVQTISRLMELAHGIVVWGSDEAVRSVREHAPVNARIIEWGHKLSFAYLKRTDVPSWELQKLAEHILSTRQLLCSSCQVVYVNTQEFEEVCQVGRRLAELLAAQEDDYPVPIPVQGKITVERIARRLEGFFDDNPCYRNGSSSVTCMRDSRLELSPQFGNVYVKPLPKQELVRELWRHRSHLQTAALYPYEPEMVLTLAKAGVTRVCRLDQMSQMDLLEAHDGMFALQQYSRLVECLE